MILQTDDAWFKRYDPLNFRIARKRLSQIPSADLSGPDGPESWPRSAYRRPLVSPPWTRPQRCLDVVSDTAHLRRLYFVLKTH